MGRVTLRIPDDLHQRLQEASRAEKISLNHLIVSALGQACTRGDFDLSVDDSLAERMKRLRLVLGDLIEDPDLSELPPATDSAKDLLPIEKFRESLPVLDPPLSATIVDEREDRR